MQPPVVSPPPPVASVPPERRLQRAAQGKFAGGVCAGIAAWSGRCGPGPVRAAFLIAAFFEPFLTGLLYLGLWCALPGPGGAALGSRSGAPMPRVSWSMRRRLKRIDKAVRSVHQRHDAHVAALVQETFDAIRLLAPVLQRPRTVRDERLAEAALIRFPRLLEKLDALAPDELADWRDRTRRTPANVLLDHLTVLHDGFIGAATQDVEDAAAGATPDDEAGGRALQSLHDRLRPLAVRLGQGGATAAVATLESIVAKLEFLLGRIDGDAQGLDLRPFKVRRIAFEYLPQTLERYLQLPAELAGSHRIAGGRTATQALQEQLELLDARLGDLTRSYYEKDAGGLLVHGRFLRDTFAEGGLQLDAPQASAPGTQRPEAARLAEPERSIH